MRHLRSFAINAVSDCTHTVIACCVSPHHVRQYRRLQEYALSLLSRKSEFRALIPCPVETLAERDNHIRESWVKAMEARIVREELVKCQRGEGVNHYKKCGHLAEMYTGMIRDNKVSCLFLFLSSL